MVQTASIKPVEFASTTIGQVGFYGVLVASIIFGIWAFSLILFLSINLSKLTVFGAIFAVVWQAFLYTGLFITAHDAMHGVVLPKNSKANYLIGSVTAFCYACFSYKSLLKNHWLHHRHPGSELDPDFHDFKRKNFFAWYFLFIKRYWNLRQWISLIVAFNLLKYAFHISEFNLILFWIIPPILSSLQLFYFGTFLTHREPQEGYTNSHRTQSTALPVFLSFITCYYFGYHEEHHEHPHVPWWQLPALRNS